MSATKTFSCILVSFVVAKENCVMPGRLRPAEPDLRVVAEAVTVVSGRTFQYEAPNWDEAFTEGQNACSTAKNSSGYFTNEP
jgi:hypothetical protein